MPFNHHTEPSHIFHTMKVITEDPPAYPGLLFTMTALVLNYQMIMK